MSRVGAVAGALVIVAAAALLGGCDGDDAGRAEEGPVACTSLYEPGRVVTARQVERGCERADGSTLRGNVCEQVNGALLVTYEDGDPQLWGFTGKPLEAAQGGDLDNDPDYTDARALC
jgi:hypothetical protein